MRVILGVRRLTVFVQGSRPGLEGDIVDIQVRFEVESADIVFKFARVFQEIRTDWTVPVSNLAGEVP